MMMVTMTILLLSVWRRNCYYGEETTRREAVTMEEKRQEERLSVWRGNDKKS